MGFLDKLNQTLNKAGEKANEMANTAKLKMDISKYNSNITGKYTKIGELVYKAEKEGADVGEEVTTYINEIDLLLEEIAKLNQQLTELAAEKEVVFVAPEPQQEVVVVVVGKACPTCGKDNEVSAMFCAGCGTKIE